MKYRFAGLGAEADMAPEFDSLDSIVAPSSMFTSIINFPEYTTFMSIRLKLLIESALGKHVR